MGLHKIMSKDSKQEIFILLGGLLTSSKIARALDSATLRGWQEFQKNHLYLELGYENFNDFLTNSDYSPMSQTRFYSRIRELETEGDQLFDFFNSLGISHIKRKLIGAGEIKLVEDKLIIRREDQQEEETTEIPVENTTQIVEAVAALADHNAEKSKQIKRRDKTIERAEKKFEKLNQKIERLKTEKFFELDGLDLQLTVAKTVIGQLRQTLLQLPKNEYASAVTQVNNDLKFSLNSMIGSLYTDDILEHEKETAKNLDLEELMNDKIIQ